MTTKREQIDKINKLRHDLIQAQLAISTTQEDLINAIPIMTPTVDENGLTVATLTENYETAVEAVMTIFNDPNLDFTQANTPQVQMAGVIAKILNDLGLLAVSLYQSFFPSYAKGVLLDNCCSINGVVRKGGTYTQIIIVLTITQAVTIRGLDNDINNPSPTSSTFTVADNIGNKYFLASTQYINQAGTYQYLFRAEINGYINPAPNTIKSITTVVIGVVSCNNPYAPAEIGQNTQTDPNLRDARARSVGMNGSGTVQNIIAGLLQIPTVVDVRVHENPNVSPADYTETPIHFIWAIINGGSDAEIANTIAIQNQPGCGMRGNIYVPVPLANGGIAPIRFDRPIEQSFYIAFEIKSIDETTNFDLPAIKNYIVQNTKFLIGDDVLSSHVTSVAEKAILETGSSKGNAQNVLLSEDNVIYSTILKPSNIAVQFLADVTKISITVLP